VTTLASIWPTIVASLPGLSVMMIVDVRDAVLQPTLVVHAIAPPTHWHVWQPIVVFLSPLHGAPLTDTTGLVGVASGALVLLVVVAAQRAHAGQLAPRDALYCSTRPPSHAGGLAVLATTNGNSLVHAHVGAFVGVSVGAGVTGCTQRPHAWQPGLTVTAVLNVSVPPLSHARLAVLVTGTEKSPEHGVQPSMCVVVVVGASVCVVAFGRQPPQFILVKQLCGCRLSTVDTMPSGH